MSFSVYRSSAGSGKTFTLVKEYLKIALTDTQDPPKAFRRILAITFTNKAAAEMKDRIIRALKELSMDDHTKISSGASTLLSALIRETGFSPDVLRERAGSVLKAIVHNYSDFAIGTIDSFVHKIVRSFAFDLKLPVHFEIELDASKLLSQAVGILISRIGEDEDLTNILLEFSEQKVEEEKNWSIEDDLNKLSSELMKEDGAKHIGKIKGLSIPDFLNISRKIKKSIGVFEKKVLNLALEALILIQSKHLEHAVFFQKDKGVRKYFENLVGGKKDDFSPNSYVKKAFEEDKWLNKDASMSDTVALESIKSRLSEIYNSIQELLREELPKYRLYILLRNHIYSLAVLNEIEKILENYKKENSILHISEFNKLIAEIVFQEPVPFIYERLGERYNNYLIDEFQDTSILQWQNLLPLIDNALSEEHFTMVVGDGKQAIYRWRGGDVAQFANLPQIAGFDENRIIAERAASLQRHYKPEFLGSNYRSKMEIISFNNGLYRALAESLPNEYKRIYDKLEQEGNPENTGGLISIEFKEEDREDSIQEARIRAIINEVLASGYAYGDIAILCRTNKEGNVLANALINSGIPVLSNDCLLLRNSRVVNFLSACMRSLYNPDDDIARAEILQFLSGQYHTSQLEIDLPSACNARQFRTWMSENGYDYKPTQLLKLPLYQLAEELPRIFGLRKTPDPYLIFFLDEILSFSNSGDNSLAAWISHWEERRDKASAIVPDGMDAVNILTIHRSKGLEYPVVILPLGNSPLKPGRDRFWVDLEEDDIPELPTGIISNQQSLEETRFSYLYEEELYRSRLDNVNLLYVATTRAEDRLYIIAGKNREKSDPWSSLSSMIAYHVKYAGMIANAEGRFVTGSGSERQKTHHQPIKQSNTLNSFISAGWTEKIRIRSAAREVWSESQKKKQDTGLLIHEILARIHTIHDLEPALIGIHSEGLVDTAEKNAIRELLIPLLTHPELSVFFEDGVKVRNEAEILLKNNTSFRPDRIVYLPGRTVILDYKTGKESGKHHEQVEQYADLLREMGETNVEKYLVYTDELRVVKV